MRSYVGGLAGHPTIFTFSRFWRIFVTSAPIFAPSGVLRCHHLLTAVLHQRYVPLVIILQLCVVAPETNAVKLFKVWIFLITDLLASSSTFHSLGERSSKDGLNFGVSCQKQIVSSKVLSLSAEISPFFLGHFQGGEPDVVEVLLHLFHLVQYCCAIFLCCQGDIPIE